MVSITSPFRGFATRGQTIDGFNSDAQINLDPIIVDRYEIVKGPNAILSPAGVPGGTINLVTKKPVFGDFGFISGEVGRFDGDRIETRVSYRGLGRNHAALDRGGPKRRKLCQRE